MKKNITRKTCSKQNKKVVVPSEKAISIIKAFARAYYVDETLTKPLNAVCVN